MCGAFTGISVMLGKEGPCKERVMYKSNGGWDVFYVPGAHPKTILKHRQTIRNVTVIFYDVTSRRSYKKGKAWLRRCEGTMRIFIGDRIDLADQRQVSAKEAQEYAQSMGASWMEISVTDVDHRTQLCRAITRLIVAGDKYTFQGANPLYLPTAEEMRRRWQRPTTVHDQGWSQWALNWIAGLF
eukprot:TRINITY_DN17115_c0_g1_i1.p1 TRINITY_DN17115_c0_g1~~TRINITY_DN17115_c0_g1_i1.p1  ORF type:complete len:184 (+),score=22.65 TRINITY_DN17115_c0_g1_i1:322-873(+)